MAHLMPSEITYAICQQATSISTAATFLTTDYGHDYGDHCLPITNIGTNLSAGQQFVDTRKAIGVPYRKSGTGYEYPKGIQSPSTTLEFDADAWNLSLFMWLLFQKGSTMATDGTTYDFTHWTPSTTVDCECEVWASIVEKMSSGTANSRAINGCICNALTLSSAVGETLKASASLIGYAIDDDYDCDSASQVWTFAEKAPLMWQDATVELDTTAFCCDGFSLTLNNNAVTRHCDSQYPTEFVLGDLTGTGEIVVPWGSATVGGATQLTNFLAGTIGRLEIYWGHDLAGVASSGDLALDMRIRLTDAERVTPDVVGTRIPFEICRTGSNGPFEAKMYGAMSTTNRGISRTY